MSETDRLTDEEIAAYCEPGMPEITRQFALELAAARAELERIRPVYEAAVELRHSGHTEDVWGPVFEQLCEDVDAAERAKP